MPLLFTILVLAAFVCRFIATFPVNHADRFAWGFALAAAVVWAIPRAT